MISFIVVLIAIILIAWALGAIPASFIYQSRKTLSESQIVKRFNNALKSLKERNLDAVKEELIECLDQYATVKEHQFAFTLAQIRKSTNEIDKQISSMKNTLSLSKRALDEYKQYHKGDSNEAIINQAAKLLYKYKTNSLIMDKLTKAKGDLSNREAELNNMLMDFNSNLAVKKAEIAIMVADSTGIFTGSTIDLRLDNLVKEFQDKVIEGKAAQDVHDKLKGEDDGSTINFASCIEEAKDLLK